MIVFKVKDMTCGHCAGAITQALQAADPGASVAIDLASQQVRVEAASADARVLRDAIAAAGFTPLRMVVAAEEKPSAGGSCCGHCH